MVALTTKGEKMKLAAALIVAGVAVVVVVAASPGGAAPLFPNPTKICLPAIAGPKVTIPWKGGRKSFHLYYASVWKYSCSSATSYMKKFYVRRSAGAETKLSGGPSGYVCTSLAPKGYTVFQGSCKAGGKTRFHGFVWTLKQA